MLRKVLVFLLVVLVIIQFFHPAKNIHDKESLVGIASIHAVPADVKTILDKACADCHSNNTRYPWYSKLQPVDWWLNDHVTDGKRALNFDEFASYPLRRQYVRLEDILKTIKEGEMPLDSYTWIHEDAVLTEAEKSIVINWADNLRLEMKQKYPADSLARKKM